MKYSTIIRKTEYGYDIHVPALPGCHSQGETEAEALESIQGGYFNLSWNAARRTPGDSSQRGRSSFSIDLCSLQTFLLKEQLMFFHK